MSRTLRHVLAAMILAVPAAAVGMQPTAASAPADGVRAVVTDEQPGDELPVANASATPETEAAADRERSRRAAGPMVAVVAVSLLTVAFALMLWILHWGRRLRQADRWSRPDCNPISQDIDPWAEAARRLKAEDRPDDDSEEQI